MARCGAPAPGALLVMVLALLLFSSAPLVRSCVPLGDPCGPAYWCCDCDPRTDYKLTCSMVWAGPGVGISYRCSTYAFEPTCNNLGIEQAFGLPRKLGFSAANNKQQGKTTDVNASQAAAAEEVKAAAEEGKKMA